MKILKSIAIVLCLFSAAIIISCEEEEDPSSTGSGAGGSSMAGTWARNDGQLSTFLKLEGTVATTCSGGTETPGTFKASSPASATFVVGGVTYLFPLSMQGDKLIVKVPSQGTVNHVDTEYIRSTSWPCGSGGTGGGSTVTAPKSGFFAVKLYSPTGTCATSGASTGSGGFYKGTLTMHYYKASTKTFSSSVVAGPGAGTTGQTDSQGHYYYSLYNHVDPGPVEGRNVMYKIEWNFTPNRTSYANSCIKTGVATIDTQGQTKQVVISW